MHIPKRFKTSNFEFVNYVVLNENENLEIWNGRNHHEVRKWMTNTEPFSFEDHILFVQSLKDRNDRFFWAVKHDGVIIGAYILNPYDPVLKQGESGKFLLPTFKGQGYGKLMTKEFLQYMFDNDLLNAVCAKTLINNFSNQHINKLMGFKITGQDDNYVYMQLNKEDYHAQNNSSR